MFIKDEIEKYMNPSDMKNSCDLNTLNDLKKINELNTLNDPKKMNELNNLNGLNTRNEIKTRKEIKIRKDQEETRQQGYAAFPCSMYFSGDKKTDTIGSTFNLPPHWHNSIELIHLKKGRYNVTINTENFIVDKDCYIFVDSGLLHSVYSGPLYRESAILFTPSILSTTNMDSAEKGIIKPVMDGSVSFPRVIDNTMPVFKEFDSIYGQLENIFKKANDRRFDQFNVSTASDQLKVKAYLMLLLGTLYDHDLLIHSRFDINPKIESLKTVITFINEHYNEKIYLHDLAQLMNLNDQYFSRFFKKMIGKNCMEYINDVRIRHAMKMLEKSDLPVLSIAYECGFGNIGHFINTFKNSTGMKPLEFRMK